MIGTFWICVDLILLGILHDGDAITHASLTKEGQLPYMAFIENNRLRCGGAVLDKYHILTAAYCVYGLSASDLSVIAGTTDVDDLLGVTRNVRKIYVHQNYRDGISCLSVDDQWYELSNVPYLRNIQSKNDIAVLTLTEPLPLGGNIKSVGLPSGKDSLPYYTRLTYSGWGKPDGESDYLLRVTILKIMYRKPCMENEFYAHCYCQQCHANIGDNGNPLVHVKENIVYVTSDAELLPGGRIIFTKVPSHLPFIQNAMNDVDDFGNC